MDKFYERTLRLQGLVLLFIQAHTYTIVTPLMVALFKAFGRNPYKKPTDMTNVLNPSLGSRII